MKKILAIMIMAVASLGAFAQDWYAGGQVGFWRNSGDNHTEFMILPEVGYNMNDQVALGATFGYDYNYEDGLKVNLFQVNPYLRYSFYNNDRVKMFLDGGVDLGIGWSKKDEHKSSTAVAYGIGLKPGLSYRISDAFSLVAHLGFVGYQGGNDASGRPDEGGFVLSGNNISFGFYVNF